MSDKSLETLTSNFFKSLDKTVRLHTEVKISDDEFVASIVSLRYTYEQRCRDLYDRLNELSLNHEQNLSDQFSSALYNETSQVGMTIYERFGDKK